MATFPLYNTQGTAAGTVERPSIFDVPVDSALIHRYFIWTRTVLRDTISHTKTRGEVSGGGRKPWRQKGTGRARQGSTRAPQWMGGGVAHGPKPRSHDIRVNKKMRRLALRSALTDAAASGKLAVVQGLAFDGPRTKDAVAVLEALGLGGRILLVLPGPDDAAERSFRNLGYVKVDYPRNLSTY